MTASSPSLAGGLKVPRWPWLPVATVLAASAVTAILPVVATLPLLPPFGYLTLLAWRLLRPGIFRIWSPVPLGLFDDLVSGQPLGSAILLWTLSFLVLDMLDRRLLWRDFMQDWLIAILASAAIIAGGLALAGVVPSPILAVALIVQWLLAMAAFPGVVRAVLAIDRWRLG